MALQRGTALRATAVCVSAGLAVSVISLSPAVFSGVQAAPTASQLGILETIAGIPQQPGYSGDGGPAISAKFSGVRDVVRGPDGSLYVSDLVNARIRRISPDGTVTTFAGTGIEGFAGDGGPATSARLNDPHNITLSPNKSKLIITDSGNSRVRSIDLTTKIITTIAGDGTTDGHGDGGPATQAGLYWPAGVTYLKDGSLLISETMGARVRRVRTDGTIETLAGTGSTGNLGNGGLATSAQLNEPRATAEGPDGSIYIGEEDGKKVRRIAPDGTITIFAGTGLGGFSGDGGPALSATVDDVRDLEVVDGQLLIADRNNGAVRSVNLTSKVITTIAGTGTRGWAGTGAVAKSSPMQFVRGISVDDGWLYIAEENAVIHRVGLTVASPKPTPTVTPTPTPKPTPKPTPTPTPKPTPTKTVPPVLPPSTVAAARLPGRRLLIDVGPNNVRLDYALRIQRLTPAGWRFVVASRSIGAKDIRTLLLPTGWYRVYVPTQLGRRASVSLARRVF